MRGGKMDYLEEKESLLDAAARKVIRFVDRNISQRLAADLALLYISSTSDVPQGEVQEYDGNIDDDHIGIKLDDGRIVTKRQYDEIEAKSDIYIPATGIFTSDSDISNRVMNTYGSEGMFLNNPEKLIKDMPDE